MPQIQINNTPPSNRGQHLLFFLMLGCCSLFFIWAAVGKLDIVSMADGRVMPSSRLKAIQHLEGGIVKEIKVREGQQVEEDQILVVLEQTGNTADVEELRSRMNALTIDIIRLEAENRQEDNLLFDKQLTTTHPDLIQQALDLFQTRRDHSHSEATAAQEIVIQRQQESRGLTTRLKNTTASLTLLKEQLAISNELLAEDLTTRYKHIALQRELTEMQGKIEQDTIALARAQSMIKEAEENLANQRHSRMASIRTELKDSRQQLAEFSLRIHKYDDTLERKIIRSPVNGIVKSLYIVTEGGVVSPGMTIMDIVPGGDTLVIEANLTIADIGYVHTGQKAIIRLASRDARRFGKLEGKVTQVSPDAFTNEEGRMYYTVRISTDKDYFEQNNHRYNLYPGVLVTASIHTGRRTVLEYLLDPFLNTLDNSLQER